MRYPPLKKSSFPRSERLACDDFISREELIERVNALTQQIKAAYSCDSSMSWMLHAGNGQPAADEDNKVDMSVASTGQADAEDDQEEEESLIPKMAE